MPTACVSCNRVHPPEGATCYQMTHPEPQPRCPDCNHRWAGHIEGDGCIARHDEDGGTLGPVDAFFTCPCNREGPDSPEVVALKERIADLERQVRVARSEALRLQSLYVRGR